jgi:hypothetical protein
MLNNKGDKMMMLFHLNYYTQMVVMGINYGNYGIDFNHGALI